MPSVPGVLAVHAVQCLENEHSCRAHEVHVRGQLRFKSGVVYQARDDGGRCADEGTQGDHVGRNRVGDPEGHPGPEGIHSGLHRGVRGTLVLPVG